MTRCAEVVELPAEKRAVAIAVANSVGNLSAFYGSQLWPSEDALRYGTGFTAIACFTGVGALMAAVGPVLFRVMPRWPTRAELEVVQGRAVNSRGEGTV